MESPSRTLTLSPSPSRRRRSSSDLVINSPEFQFWNSGHVSTPLHSADQLFSNGFLLPLRSLEINSRSEPTKPEIEPGFCKLSTEPSALITSEVSSNNNPILSASKRWKEIFKRSDRNSNNNDLDEGKNVKVEKRREKNRKNNGSSSSAELNINIWPFSRSRSAGNNTTRSNNKPATSNRKVSSAPCSRSNSSGESKSLRRAWPASPGRAGVHLGRASPVWNVKRAGLGGGVRRERENVVPVCVGSYRQGLGCRSEGDAVVVDGGGVVKSGGGNNSNLFGFRGLFSKKSSSGSSTVLTV